LSSGMEARRRRTGGFVDRDRRRWKHHRLHGERGARPGHLPRAVATGGRGALGSHESRQDDLLRYTAFTPDQGATSGASRTQRISIAPILRKPEPPPAVR
jgi:hypothetical protein